jgi:hypothetical protein
LFESLLHFIALMLAFSIGLGSALQCGARDEAPARRPDRRAARHAWDGGGGMDAPPGRALNVATEVRSDTARAYQEYLFLFWRGGKHAAEAWERCLRACLFHCRLTLGRASRRKSVSAHREGGRLAEWTKGSAVHLVITLAYLLGH